jgi:sugar/nucleoside kinase (ribokinase family)
MLVCTLGDLALDVLVLLARPLTTGGDTDARIRLAPGGQAANVAAWASALGASARFVGKRGDDDAAGLALAGLAARGVEVLGPAGSRSAVVCSLVTEGGERAMASDRGAAADLRPEEIEAPWLDGCDHLFVSGYVLGSEASRRAALRAVEVARAGRASVSVDLASWLAIRDAGPNAFRTAVEELAPDVVFANEDEDRAVGGPLPGVTWILKRGPRGCSFDGDERPALPVERVVDSTGAGDALAAGWIVGGADLALEAAARCVAGLGSMP